MAQDITFRPGIEGLMAALAVAEQLSAGSSTVPASVRVDEHSGWLVGQERPLGVHLYFHRDEDAVRAFADRFEAKTNSVVDGPDRLTVASGVLSGVPFRAWTLTDVEAAQVAA